MAKSGARRRAEKKARRAALTLQDPPAEPRQARGEGSEAGVQITPNLFREGASPREINGDAALVRRAMRERWPVPAGSPEALRNRVTLRAMQAEDDRALANLARVVLAMEAQNQRDDLAYDPFKEAHPTAGAATAPALVQVVFNPPDNGRGPG